MNCLMAVDVVSTIRLRRHRHPSPRRRTLCPSSREFSRRAKRSACTQCYFAIASSLVGVDIVSTQPGLPSIRAGPTEKVAQHRYNYQVPTTFQSMTQQCSKRQSARLLLRLALCLASVSMPSHVANGAVPLQHTNAGVSPTGDRIAVPIGASLSILRSGHRYVRPLQDMAPEMFFYRKDGKSFVPIPYEYAPDGKVPDWVKTVARIALEDVSKLPAETNRSARLNHGANPRPQNRSSRRRHIRHV